MPEPNLSVVVLAWNQADVTRSCIASVRANTAVGCELILVDNGSEPRLDAVLEDTGDVYVRNEDNLGFAAGMNRGLAAVTSRHVAFLNNDTVVPKRWAQPLLDTLTSSPSIGIVVPAVTAAGNPISVRSVAGTETIVVPPFRALPSAVAYVMVTETIRGLGGWDERYVPATAEDLDLLWSVWVNGLDVVIDERVLIDHVGSATIKQDLPQAGQVLRSNRMLFVDRWTGADPDPPGLGLIGDDAFEQNLATAGVAAHWMRRAFAAEDTAAAMRREAAAQRIPAPAEHRTRSRIGSLLDKLRGG